MRKLLSALGAGGSSLFASESRRFPAERVMMLPASRALRINLSAAADLDAYLDVVSDFGYHRLSVALSQIRSEISSLLRFLDQSRFGPFSRLARGLGRTIILFARVVSKDAVLITVDFPAGVKRSRLLKAEMRSNQRIHVLRAYSHDRATVGKITKLVDNFLFIDGDRSYDGVRQGYSVYSRLVRPMGLIAFHDIVPSPEEGIGGVPRLWDELKQEFKT